MAAEPRDEFLSEEDLDLKSLSWDELIAYWNLWLEQAQVSNDLDANEYSHGVFVLFGDRYRNHPARRKSRESSPAHALPAVDPQRRAGDVAGER